jgi:hypothetical protein
MQQRARVVLERDPGAAVLKVTMLSSFERYEEDIVALQEILWKSKGSIRIS